MDEFSARCVGKLQLADSTTTDPDILRDPIVLLVELLRRPPETYRPALAAMHYSRNPIAIVSDTYGSNLSVILSAISRVTSAKWNVPRQVHV